MMKSKFLIALFAAFLSLASPAQAGAVIGATEPTQIFNNIQLVLAYAEQAQQTVTQYNQYKTMLKNLEQMTPSAYLDEAAQKLFTDQQMYQTFKRMQTLVKDGQRVGYSLSNINSEFKRVHPGYGGHEGDYDFNKGYRDWSDNTLDSIKNSMSLAGAHATDFDTEQELMYQLQQKSRTAGGQLQALQVGNQISMSMVTQFQKLRQMSMAQMQSQNAFMAGQQSTQDAGNSAAQKVYGPLSNSRLK